MEAGAMAAMSLLVPGSTGRTAPEALSREERSQLFGVDCATSLVWRRYEAGEQYPKTLVLRNLTPGTITLRYKIPVTKFFTMAYPTPLKLAAGTSVSLPVRAV